VVLNTLGAEDYGIYNVVGGVVAMLGFLNSTLASGTQRFLTFQLGKNDFTELKKVFSIALNIHILLAIGILILAETAGIWFLNHKINMPSDRRHAAFWVYQFSIFASLLSIVQVPYNAAIIAHERMNIYAYISIVEAVLKLVVVYVLRAVNFDKLSGKIDELYTLLFQNAKFSFCLMWLPSLLFMLILKMDLIYS
jgi:O-antigen/teichoic acid export membrane protein